MPLRLFLDRLTEREIRRGLGNRQSYDEIIFRVEIIFRDKLPINMKILVFFLAKCVWTAAKTMAVDRKNQTVLALLYLASKPLRNAANSSGVLTEFATEPTRQI